MTPMPHDGPRHRVRRPTRFVAKIVLVVGAASVALGIVEVLLRFFGLPANSGPIGFVEMSGENSVFVEDESLFWRMRPGNRVYPTNRLGLRGPLPDGPKRHGVLRVACVGDSCVFGLGVRYEHTFGVRFARRLQAESPARRVECILAGLPGYSSYQSRVLFEREIAPLEPDVTVVYCGAWNDHVPAIELSDRSRAKRSANVVGRLRLTRVMRALLAPSPSKYAAALEKGEFPDGPRVSLEEFEENLTAIATAARAVGSEVVFVVPPVTDEFDRFRPVAKSYRDSIRSIAREQDAELVDVAPVLQALRERLPSEWSALRPGEWPFLVDRVHPSAEGHRQIADALRVAIDRRLAFPSRDPAVPQFRVDSVEPERITPFVDEVVRVRGTGFSQHERFDELWLGDTWIPEVRVVDDRVVEFRVPEFMPPGEHELQFVTAFGPVGTGRNVVVDAVTVRTHWIRRDDDWSLELDCRGPANGKFALWFGDLAAGDGLEVVAGRFRLEGYDQPPGYPAAPFRVDRLALPERDGVFDRHGRWTDSMPVSIEARAGMPASLSAQGLILDPLRAGFRLL
ncbi:MAG: SGNH/GDSL hydrolase family protein, partial [Planctomycetes bacterium]|nr:SGNH/GDSL hydrolase family protein [Planctomycetota bacterium]